MDALTALAEPHRRRVVEILARRGELTASEIYDEFEVTPQAVSQHLRVLREANVVQMQKRAQRRLYTINPRSVAQIEEWAASMGRLWSRRLDRLEQEMKERER